MIGRAAALVLVLALALGGVACSGDDVPKTTETLQQALAAHQAGDLDRAIELYKQVIANDHENKFAWYNLGLIHQQRGSNNLAGDEYANALEIDPDFVPALFNLAILKAAQGDTQGAVDLYRKVVELKPDYAGAHLNLGFALIDLGEKHDGKAELAIAVSLDPSLESRIPSQIAEDLQPPVSVSPAASVSVSASVSPAASASASPSA